MKQGADKLLCLNISFNRALLILTTVLIFGKHYSTYLNQTDIRHVRSIKEFF